MSVSSNAIDLFKSVLITLLPVVIAAKLAVGQFNNQKKWERRAKEYDSLFAYLIEIRAIYEYADSYHEDIFIGEDVSREKPNWARAFEIESELEVRYILADVNLSNKAKLCFGKYFQRKMNIERNYMENENYEFEIYRSEANIAKMLIDELKPIAIKDLKVRDKKYLFF